MAAGAALSRPRSGGPPERLVVWRFSDGRTGHDKQSLGLAEALGRRIPVELSTIPAPPPRKLILDAALARFPPGDALPAPSLILGAGHRTHLPMLVARRARGGSAVVLMRPTLPMRWFDLCMVPEHDDPPSTANVIPTVGVLNRISPVRRSDPSAGLILVGGPSRHHAWDPEHLIAQLGGILDGHRMNDGRQISWVVADSPRTPSTLRGALRELCAARDVPFRTASETNPDWLDGRLAESGCVWVGEDSMSMIFEALTAGAAVGLLEMPRRRRGRGRVSRAVDGLVDRGWVTTYERWTASGCGSLPTPPRALAEADRCAELLLERIGAERCR